MAVLYPSRIYSSSGISHKRRGFLHSLLHILREVLAALFAAVWLEEPGKKASRRVLSLPSSCKSLKTSGQLVTSSGRLASPLFCGAIPAAIALRARHVPPAGLAHASCAVAAVVFELLPVGSGTLAMAQKRTASEAIELQAPLAAVGRWLGRPAARATRDMAVAQNSTGGANRGSRNAASTCFWVVLKGKKGTKHLGGPLF